MLTLADKLLVLFIVVGLPLRAWYGMRRLNAAPAGELAALRPRLWGRAILSQWVLVGLVLAVWLATRRSLGALGLSLRPSGGLAGVMVGLVTIVILVLRQRGAVDTDESIRDRIRERLAPVARLMPRQGSDFRLFAALACTAGLCEEFLFRGYLAWVAGLVLPFPVAPAAQALVFGICHMYQGWRGIVLTTFAGAFLTAMVLVTGSLWPSILIHALMDLHAGDLARRVFPRDDEPGVGPVLDPSSRAGAPGAPPGAA
jgi:CAAX protease family protein